MTKVISIIYIYFVCHAMSTYFRFQIMYIYDYKYKYVQLPDQCGQAQGTS